MGRLAAPATGPCRHVPRRGRPGYAHARARRRAQGEETAHYHPFCGWQTCKDLLNRDFSAPAPNRVQVTDFTYVPARSGFVYVAFVVDVFAQMIVGWHVSSTKSTDLVMTPLRIAIWQRQRQGNPVAPGELIHHSDAGSQYTSIRYTEHLDLEGIAGSIGTVGDAYDNALMETINGLYTTECVRTTVFHAGPYRTVADVEFATAGWVDWYNNRRLHGSLGMLTPVEFETLHYQALAREPEPTK